MMPPPSEQPTTSGVTVAGGIDRHAHVVQQPVDPAGALHQQQQQQQVVQQLPPQPPPPPQPQPPHHHNVAVADEEESEAIYAESACTSAGIPAPSRRSHMPLQPTTTNRSNRTEGNSRMHRDASIHQALQQEAVSPIKLPHPPSHGGSTAAAGTSGPRVIQLHFRLTDGQSLFSSFEETVPLSAVVDFLDANRTDEPKVPYRLSMAYPRRDLFNSATDGDSSNRLATPLRDLDLANRSTLLLTPIADNIAGRSKPSTSLFSGFGQVFDYVNPLNILGGVSRSDGEGHGAEGGINPSTFIDDDGDSAMLDARQQQSRRGAGMEYAQVGGGGGLPSNVATLSGLENDDAPESDCNEFFNGNSTLYDGRGP